MSVINGQSSPCLLDVNPDTFVVKIYSGSDRIWTTGNCDRWLGKAITGQELKPEASVGWSIDWPGQRSHPGCRLVGGLRQGTYVATAQLTLDKRNATPVQLVMRVS